MAVSAYILGLAEVDIAAEVAQKVRELAGLLSFESELGHGTRAPEEVDP